MKHCGNCAHRHAPKWYCTSVPHIYGEGGVHHIGWIARVLVAMFGCPYWWKL